MGLAIGSGLQAWIQQHQATPLSDEVFFSPDNNFSAVVVQVANSEGTTIHTIVGWDLANAEVMEPGPGTLARLFTPQDAKLAGITMPDPPANVVVDVPDSGGFIPTPLAMQSPPQGTNPATGRPAATDPLGIFVERLLLDLNMSPGDQRVALVDAWARAEGGVTHNNPLNITAPLNGSWAWPGQTGFWNNLGTIGVVNFDNPTNAADATAEVIRQPNMVLIMSALLSEDPQQFVDAIAASPWGTNPGLVKQILGI